MKDIFSWLRNVIFFFRLRWRHASCSVVMSMMFALLLTSCGYHMVGQADSGGAIPEDVTTVSIQGLGGAAETLLPELKRQFAGNNRYQMIAVEDVTDAQAHAVLRIEQAAETFVPSAYDQSGIATQYRMTISGNVRIYREGKLIWETGVVSESGDVYVAGGPTGIESSRKKIQENLRKAWIFAVWGRINSGF